MHGRRAAPAVASQRLSREPGTAARATAGLMLAATLVALLASPAWGARSSPARPAPPRVRAQRRAPVVIPVLAGELVAPMMSYRAYVVVHLNTLRDEVATLVAAVDAGDVAGAESAWLSAHLTWLEIGQDDGPYSAFAGIGREIDGTAAGLIRGTQSPELTGFHKVELDLWTDHDHTAAADAARLQTLVGVLARRSLAKELPTSVAGLTDWTLRCHEILEDALRDSLSANDNYGSGTDLASVTADVTATREMLDVLAPLIEPAAPHLVGRARRELAGLVKAADATRRDGRWVAIGALPAIERERVDAAAGAALETLAPVPDLLRIVNSS